MFVQYSFVRRPVDPYPVEHEPLNLSPTAVTVAGVGVMVLISLAYLFG